MDNLELRRLWSTPAAVLLLAPAVVFAALPLGVEDRVFQDGFERPPGPPIVVLGATPTVVSLGQSTRLTWTTTDAQSCVAFASPHVVAWSGLQPLQGMLDVTAPAHGIYQFSMICTNAHGSTTSGVSVVVNNTPVPQNYCEEYLQAQHGGVPPADPAFTAFGFARVEVPFSQVFGVPPGVPSSGSTPLPALHLSSSNSRYLAIPFAFGFSAEMMLQWIDSGVSPFALGPVRVTISPCPGDFRAAQAGSPDAYLRPNCRTSSVSVAGQLGAASNGNPSACLAPLGKTLYINIVTHTTSAPDGGAYTCPQPVLTCAVGMTAN